MFAMELVTLSTLLPADILLHWIWMLHSGIPAQRLGYSGTIVRPRLPWPQHCSIHIGFLPGTFFVCFLVQQVYMYFRGSGKAAEMKRQAARSTMMAAL